MKKIIFIVLSSILAVFIFTRVVTAINDRYGSVGLASWYGEQWRGRKTANGEIFDPDKLTAAHRVLPFGTVVEVTNLKNKRKIKVRINDRGPFVRGRMIDLSRGAARRLGMLKDGLVKVRIRVKK